MDLRGVQRAQSRWSGPTFFAASTLDRGSPNLTEQGNLGFVGRTGAGLGLAWTLPLASRRRKIRRQDKGESKIKSGRKEREDSPSNCDWSVDG